ncbi:phage portal protein [bacterium]|nr:phage portal protein [bacterium]
MWSPFRTASKRREPALGERKSGGALAALAGLPAAHWSGAGVLAREGFERNAVGYRCVRMIAETAASLPMRPTGAAGGGGAPGDRLARLVERPNAFEAGADLMETFYGHLLIHGEAYLEAVRIDDEVRELHVLRPDRMRVVKGPRGWPAGWEHRVEGRVRRLLPDGDGFSPVLQLKLFHPSDDYRGHAPLEAAARAVDVHNSAGAWAKALIDNAARPSGALIYGAGEALTEDQYQRLKDELEQSHQGAANAGRPLLLEGGLDWKPMSLTPAEMDFIEARNAAAREIALAFGTPPMLLGIPGDATYANYREANAAFWRLTVLPLAQKAGRALSRWLGDRLGGGVAPDVEHAPAFQDERQAQWARVDAASFLSVEEKRRLVGIGDADAG